jgi:hypothetical protein
VSQLITTTTDTAPPGPLKLPAGRSVLENRVAKRLPGHATSPRRLPEQQWPELDEQREQQEPLRRAAAAAIDELATLRRKFRREDAARDAELKRAALAGQTPPEDRRTAQVERERLANDATDRTCAIAAALADQIDTTIALVRQREEEWIGTLRERLMAAEADRREAERLLAQARIAEWGVHQLAAWVLSTSEDGPLGRQPGPIPSLPPRDFQTAVTARPWWRAQDMATRAGAA